LAALRHCIPHQLQQHLLLLQVWLAPLMGHVCVDFVSPQPGVREIFYDLVGWLHF
jgi:hypothetical protein